LDYGLASGVGLSLLLSTIGGIWLTRRAMQPIEQSFDRLKQFTIDYDLILLDLMLPKLDGISLCQQLRNAKHNVLILRQITTRFLH
jgi:DNA-binding response OmpR family regulator